MKRRGIRWHYSEAELVALARGRPGQKPDGFPDAGRHLAVCDTCRREFLFLQEFTEELRKAIHQDDHAGVRAIVGTASTPYLIALTRFAPRRRPEWLTSSNGLLILAAQGGGGNKTRFTPVASLAAESEHILLRVIHDRRDDVDIVHLHAPVVSRSRHVLVGVAPSAGEPVLVATDSRGRATMRRGLEAWQNATVLLHFPLASWTFPEGLTASCQRRSGHAWLIVDTGEGELTLRAGVDRGTRSNYLLLIPGGGQSTLYDLTPDPISLPAGVAAGIREIRLFP